MQVVKVVFRHNKFYDTESKKRVIINESSQLTIVVDEKDMVVEDAYNLPVTGRDSKELYNDLCNKRYHSFKSIARAGQEMTFTIKAGKRKDVGSYAIECDFTLRLLSDLYMIQKHPTSKYGVVNSCECLVEKVKGPLENFEPIYAYSLNDAYMKTYDFYFALYGKPTVNIYNRFWVKVPKNAPNNNDKQLLMSLRMFS